MAMRTCGPGCHPACDFCVHYVFNGEPHTGLDGSVAMVYVGKGECRHPAHAMQRDPGDYCGDFYCTRAAREDAKREKHRQEMEAVTAELERLWVKGEE